MKLIIDNRSDLDMIVALTLVTEVIKHGRVSNNGKQYCYLTSYTYDNKEYHFVSDLNDKSDRILIYEARKNLKI